MQFNPGDGSGIVDEIDALCDSDSNAYPIASKTRRVNAALETLVGKIINADGTWQFDDTNNTTLPIGIGNLVEGQASYTFSDAFLDLLEIDILDFNGLYRRITPFDPSEVDMSFEEYFGNTTSVTTKGMPRFYDKQGNSIRLGPAPTATAVTLTAGLKAHFKRTASLFATTDTSKQPGFASPYHVLLAYMAAIPYCMTYKKDRVALYQQQIATMTADLVAFYGRREKDKRNQATMKPIAFR